MGRHLSMSQQESSSENPSSSRQAGATAPGDNKNTRLRSVQNSNPKGLRFKARTNAGEAEAPEDTKIENQPTEEASRRPEQKPPSPKKAWEFKFTPQVIAAGLVALLMTAIVFGGGFGAGQWWLQRKLAKQQEERTKEFSAVAQGRLNEAMKNLRDGDVKEALAAFQAMGKEFPYVPSLAYLSAVAAMQAGEMGLAEGLVAKSLELRERESDAFALQAIIETQKVAARSKVSLGDPTIRSEKLLWTAVLADPANPLPFIELATLMRYKGRHDDAKKALESAQVRLQPVDSHVVVSVTLALVRLEEMPTESLVDGDYSSDDVNILMPAAYVALRKESFDQALATLKRCRALMPADLYDYLVNDPAFRKFSYRTELKTVFQN